MTEDNNIIQFPKGKTKTKTKISFDLENKKIMISASLASLLFVVMVANTYLMAPNLQAQHSNSLNQGSRSIASVGSFRESNLGNLSWEVELAKNLASTEHKKFIVRGRAPSSEDILRFEILEGKYSTLFKRGKVAELEFINDRQFKAEPTQLLNPRDFIENNKNMFLMNFKRVDVSKISYLDNGNVLNKYNLLNEKNQVLGQAEMVLDKNQRLISMKIRRL